MSRRDSAATVPKTSEDLPEPETPVKTVSRRLGISTSTLRRLFSLAPRTVMVSWAAAARGRGDADSGGRLLSITGTSYAVRHAGGRVKVVFRLYRVESEEDP
ncbi:hypothetical protein GCM10009618_16740 [Nesterenkonia lacusekhoensis]